MIYSGCDSRRAESNRVKWTVCEGLLVAGGVVFVSCRALIAQMFVFFVFHGTLNCFCRANKVWIYSLTVE